MIGANIPINFWAEKIFLLIYIFPIVEPFPCSDSDGLWFREVFN